MKEVFERIEQLLEADDYYFEGTCICKLFKHLKNLIIRLFENRTHLNINLDNSSLAIQASKFDLIKMISLFSRSCSKSNDLIDHSFSYSEVVDLFIVLVRDMLTEKFANADLEMLHETAICLKVNIKLEFFDFKMMK